MTHCHIYDHVSIHGPLSQAIGPVTYNFVAWPMTPKSWLNYHILPFTGDQITDWQIRPWDNDPCSPKAKIQSSLNHHALMIQVIAESPTTWKLWYSKRHAMAELMFNYCFGTGKYLMNGNNEKLTWSLCMPCFCCPIYKKSDILPNKTNAVKLNVFLQLY